MSTLEITTDNFETTISNSPIVFLDFWATWCGPCRQFGPIFEKASEQHPDIVFGKVDTDAQMEISQGAQITSIPTLMAFRDGISIFRQAGALPAPAFEDLIKQVRELDMEKVKADIEAEQVAKTD